MGQYKLTEDAKADLNRIHQYGVLKFGEAQADKYFMAFLISLNLSLISPFYFQAWILSEKELDVVFVGQIAYFSSLRMIRWK